MFIGKATSHFIVLQWVTTGLNVFTWSQRCFLIWLLPTFTVLSPGNSLVISPFLSTQNSRISLEMPAIWKASYFALCFPLCIYCLFRNIRMCFPGSQTNFVIQVWVCGCMCVDVLSTSVVFLLFQPYSCKYLSAELIFIPMLISSRF